MTRCNNISLFVFGGFVNSLNDNTLPHVYSNTFDFSVLSLPRHTAQKALRSLCRFFVMKNS